MSLSAIGSFLGLCLNDFFFIQRKKETIDCKNKNTNTRKIKKYIKKEEISTDSNKFLRHVMEISAMDYSRYFVFLHRRSRRRNYSD